MSWVLKKGKFLVGIKTEKDIINQVLYLGFVTCE